MVSRLEARATRHYYDSAFQCQAVKVLPNEYYVTDEDLMISTVLGSCVAACIHDPKTGVGGMNHFMLPEGDMQSPASATMRYGAFAMEVLINELLKAGASRDRLEAKVFGGGAVLSAMQQMNIGERNGQFVLNYLKTEGIPVRPRTWATFMRGASITSARRPGDGAQDGAPSPARRGDHRQARTGRRAKRAGQDREPAARRTLHASRRGAVQASGCPARRGALRHRARPPRRGTFQHGRRAPGVERFDTGITRRNKTETTG